GGLTKPLGGQTTKEQKEKKTGWENLTTTSITGGPSNPKGRSGGTMERRITEMCSVGTDTTSPRKE
ncbi:hypothetical protein A2U01_0114264, partial [Trifolium medium]|nr:hypothetical protein [Trifolium medium]